MRRMFWLVLFIVIYVGFGKAQTAKPLQATPLAEKFTEQQASLARTFLESLLKYVDEKTRDDSASSTDPLCLPQRPVIKLSYHGREISTEQFTRFRSTARSAAPSVRLVGPTDTTSGAYTIDILEVKEGNPLSSVRYRHSRDLTFPSRESQPWFGPTTVPMESRGNGTIITSEALILYQWTTVTLSRGHFAADLWEKDTQEVKDHPVLEGVAKAIAALHAKAGEQAPQASNLLPYYSAQVRRFENRLESTGVKVVFARRSVSSGFVGAGYAYLLVKQESGWEVIDARVTSFSDSIMSWPCSIR